MIKIKHQKNCKIALRDGWVGGGFGGGGGEKVVFVFNIDKNMGQRSLLPSTSEETTSWAAKSSLSS